MKKILKSVLLVCILGVLVTPLNADNITHEQEVQFKKQTPSGPSRVPSPYPVSFNGTLFMDVIDIYAENYSGNITVQITGNSGSLTQAQQISDAIPVTIDVSSLSPGTYTIEIITAGKGIFTGDFEI